MAKMNPAKIMSQSNAMFLLSRVGKRIGKGEKDKKSTKPVEKWLTLILVTLIIVIIIGLAAINLNNLLNMAQTVFDKLPTIGQSSPIANTDTKDCHYLIFADEKNLSSLPKVGELSCIKDENKAQWEKYYGSEEVISKLADTIDPKQTDWISQELRASQQTFQINLRSSEVMAETTETEPTAITTEANENTIVQITPTPTPEPTQQPVIPETVVPANDGSVVWATSTPAVTTTEETVAIQTTPTAATPTSYTESFKTMVASDGESAAALVAKIEDHPIISINKLPRFMKYHELTLVSSATKDSYPQGNACTNNKTDSWPLLAVITTNAADYVFGTGAEKYFWVDLTPLLKLGYEPINPCDQFLISTANNKPQLTYGNIWEFGLTISNFSQTSPYIVQ